MPYPEFHAGMRLTAQHLTLMQPVYIRKINNETYNTDTLHVDAELTTTLEPGLFYELSGVLYVSGPADADMLVRMNMPINGWCEFMCQSPGNGVSTMPAGMDYTRRGAGSPFSIGTAGTGTVLSIHYHGLGYSGDGGTMSWSWCKNTATGADLMVRSGSYIRAQIAF